MPIKPNSSYMETLCELLHGDSSKDAVYLEDKLCLSCTNVILQKRQFLSFQKLEVLQILNEELQQSSNLEELLREETGVFFHLVDSLGCCLLNSDLDVTIEGDFPENHMLFESVCICLNNIICHMHSTLGRKQAEKCLDLLLMNIETQENEQDNSLEDGLYKIIFFLLFFMKKEEQKDADVYDMTASKVLRNNKVTSFIVNLICHNNLPNIRMVAASLIMECLQIVCFQENTIKCSMNYNVTSRSFGTFFTDHLPSEFENLLELDPDITDPTLQEYLVRIVSYLIRCSYPNLQAMIDKIILFLQLRCLFPDIRVRFLVVDALRSLLERIDWAGIAQYVFITGMPEYLLESMKTAFQMKLETDADFECLANCFEGIFSVMQKLLKLEETRETLSSFVFQSIVQGMVSFLKLIKTNKQFENSQLTNQLLFSFFSLSHTFLEDVAFTSETDSTNSICAQRFISLKFFIPFIDFLSKNETLEEEMSFLLVEMTKERQSSLDEQLELLVQLNTKFKSRGCIMNVAYTLLCNIIRTAEEERPTNCIEIFHRILTPHLTEFNVENVENKKQIDVLLNYLRLVNDFLVPTFWKGQTVEKLVIVCKKIWKNFHLIRLFSLFQMCSSIEKKTQLSKTFRAFIARLLTVLDPDIELDDVSTSLPLNDVDLCKSLQQISDESYFCLKLILLDHSIRGDWALELRKLCYCVESISNKLPEKESAENIKLAELVSQIWVILCREKTCADFETKSRGLMCLRQPYITKTFISFLFKYLPKPISRNINSIKLLIENSQIDMEACQILQMRLVSLQNEQFQDAQVAVEETTNYFRVLKELISSFDCYGELFLHDISRFIQWLRFPLENIDMYSFKEAIQFWCNGLLHFTDDQDTERIVLRLVKLGLLRTINEFVHATVDYYKKGYNEKEQLHLSSQTSKLIVYLFQAFNKSMKVETGTVEYLDEVNELLQSLLTAVDSFATFSSQQTLCEFLNCLHILVNFFDRMATSENVRVTSSASKSLVRNIISKKAWLHLAIREYFELLLNHQCQHEPPFHENGCSYQPHWESLLSLSTTFIAFGSKKNLQLLETFPKSLLSWRNAIFACCKFQQHQRPLLTAQTNLLFACVARAREYEWEREQTSQHTENDCIFYSFCNQIFSSYTLIEISAYRAMEAWILSLRESTQPIPTTFEAVKSCLRIKLIQNHDTPLLVLAPRLSLFVRFLQLVDHSWVSKSHWESIFQLISQLLTNMTASNRVQRECIQHLVTSLQYAPINCLERHPDIMEAIQNLESLNTCQATTVSCPIIFDDVVLTPVISQWQQDFFHVNTKEIQSVLANCRKLTTVAK